MNLKPNIFIFSAPSGAGKTTIVKAILKNNPNLQFSISATTRPIRTNETNGKDYYFLSIEDFKNKMTTNELLEWQEVYPDRFYGTLKSEIERITNNNHYPIFDVDVKGGINLKKLFGNQSLSFFIQPPSIEILQQRLIARGTDSQADIKQRIAKATYELTFANQFDKIIINDDLNKAILEVENYINLAISK